MQPNAIRISSLTDYDVPHLEDLEVVTGLCFWGNENYARFLEQPEYFGRKVTATSDGWTNHLVGFFLARSVLENLELLKIGVYPKFQNQGIGTLLLNAAFYEGTRRGCLRCFLEVRKSNEGAIRFYLNHRFKLAGERVNYYSDPVEDALVMEREL